MATRTTPQLFTIATLVFVLLASYMLAPIPAAYAGSAAIIQVDDAAGGTYSNDAVLTAGQILTVYARVTNNSSTLTLTGVDLTLTGTCSGVASINKGFSAVDISPLATKIFPVQIIANATVSQSTCTAIKATVTGDTASVNFFFYIGSEPATATPTNTVGPTLTPSPTPAPENYYNCDTDVSYSKSIPLQIGIDIFQIICQKGDVNSYQVPLRKDKVYSIYVDNSYAYVINPDELPPILNESTNTESDEALVTLDLVMKLYDPSGLLVYMSDDSFELPSPNMIAIDPSILNYRAPVDGVYTLQIYEATSLDIGAYTLHVDNKSYNGSSGDRLDPNIPFTGGLCTDLFEPDGLPEQASLIFSNQIQRDHRLCPTGDADWVKFFAKTGNTYILSTDTTKIEFPNNSTDTAMILFGRDAYTELDRNDNKDTTTFDSYIEFSPEDDGFYFIQIKNIGDLGNPFFQYNLENKVCPNATESCVQGSTTPTATNDIDMPPTRTPIGFDDVYPTKTPEIDSSTGYERAGYQPTSELINGPLKTFVNRAFEYLWARSDRPVVRQQAKRSWLWGPTGLMARSEAYLQITGGMRQVQYFDKGRMEINNPNANPRNSWFVTSGLLVRELITGQMQVGNADFIDREPSDVSITGDTSDRSGPTYASFAGVIGAKAPNRVGAYADSRIDRNGTVSPYDASGINAARIGFYAPTTGHNIPQVFYEYLTSADVIYVNGRSQRGALMDNWVATMGYPLSEAYWTKSQINGIEQWVMVQPFERRVLTYVPNNPAGWQIEQGNVGRHYYRWRYGVDPTE